MPMGPRGGPTAARTRIAPVSCQRIDLPLGHADTRKSTVVDTEVWKWQ